MEEFRHFSLVRPEFLNHYGCVFGGHLLQIIDEIAFITCTRTFPGHNFVTRALQNVEFHAPGHLGDILETISTVESVGNTSCRVRVQTYFCDSSSQKRQMSFDGTVIMVNIDQTGTAAPIKHSKE